MVLPTAARYGGALPVDQLLRAGPGYCGGEVAALLEGAQFRLLTTWVRRMPRRGSSLVGDAPIRSKTPAAGAGIIGRIGLPQRISSRSLNPGRDGTPLRASAPTGRARTSRNTAAGTAERPAVDEAPRPPNCGMRSATSAWTSFTSGSGSHDERQMLQPGLAAASTRDASADG